jgi:predicted PurR-regulated permease PerM
VAGSDQVSTTPLVQRTSAESGDVVDPALRDSVSVRATGADDDADQRREPPVPIRTILATIGLVLATLAVLYVVVHIRQILTWIIIAAFFAVALSPLVGWLQRRVFGKRRALATLVVFLLVLVALSALSALFILPLATEGKELATQLPSLIEQTRQGRGPIGDLLQRTNALEYVQTHQDQISAYAKGLSTPAAGVLVGIATGIAGTATIFVLSYLMVLEGPRMVDSGLHLFRPRTATRIRRVAEDCARAITGYISGNLLISVICGVATYILLKAFGVPFAGLIAVFVAVADLIPMIGATIGAVVSVAAGFIHSVPAGIAALVFFLVYQQLENHLLQPVIYARTVKLNPLTVIIAILVAVEVAGILGALLAIPVASMIQVIMRDVWDHRTGRPKTEPTVGEDAEPAVAAG